MPQEKRENHIGYSLFLQLFSPTVFVWGMLLLMTLMMLWFLRMYSCPVPYVDAWIIAVDASAENWSWSWLWEQQNEHRYPLVKGLAWICYHTYGSMQPLSVLSVLTCTATSAAFLLAARRLRGRSEWTDAVFPILFLNGFHIENILWTHQLFFVAAGCLACWCGLYLMAKPESHRWFPTLLAALALFLLPLHGVMGLVFAPFLGVGFFWHGWVVFRQNSQNRIAWLNMAVPVLTAILCLLYVLVDFHIPGGHRENLASDITLWQRGKVILDCAAIGMGALGNRIPGVLGQGLFLLTLLTLGTLLFQWRQKQLSDEEAFSLLLILAAVWSLPLAIGIGRGVMGGAAPRYTILAVPLLAFYILFWIRFGTLGNIDSPHGWVFRFSRLLQVSFFTFFTAFLMYHVSMAMEYGKERQNHYHAFLADVQKALPLEAIAGRGWAYWCWNEKDFVHFLHRMKENGIAPFDQMQSVGLTEVEEIPLSQKSWNSRVPIAIPLEIPGGKRHVDAIRLTFQLDCDHWRSDTAIYWDSSSLAFPHVQKNQIKMGTNPYSGEWTVWIDAEVSRLELVPNTNAPFSFQLYKVTLCERDSTDEKSSL
ncbi:MAG: hypothetical protein Q4D38_00365 [Planctomycetia bacterium]|nr:hypothetical protein [Planctomycetia bacterium]